MKPWIMLITYADSMGGDLAALRRVLARHFQHAVGNVHLLPFYPSSADRGFAPLCYDRVDPAFGTYEEVTALSREYGLMVDFMINHISRSSSFFRDYVARGGASPYRELFIRWKEFWPGGAPTPEQLRRIYKRKPKAPETEIVFADGTREKLWCTFGEEQIDLNVSTPVTRRFIRENLAFLCEQGAAMIRLDAFAYAVKQPGTDCFFREPEIWELLAEAAQTVAPYGVELLPEIHEHYTIQLKLAEKGYWIYDFALPMLLLHAIYQQDGQYLKHWLEISPKKQFTTLDTHDGIGIVDVKDLLPEEEIQQTKEKMFTRGANVKKIYNTAAYHNLDIYQVNTTYYSALGNDDEAYLLARAVQFFAKGIPQVYYVGLLAGENDIEGMERTKNGRDINRHGYSEEEIDRAVQRPVVQKLLRLMRMRNTHPAFDPEGELTVEQPDRGVLCLTRTAGPHWAKLTADFTHRKYEITLST